MGHESAVRRWVAAPPLEWSVKVAKPASDPAGAPLDRWRALPDEALVAGVQAGDREAFDVIVERHRRTIYRVCYRFVNSHEDASDLAQDVFVRAWRGLPRFRGGSALSTWLYRIAVNVCLSRLAAKPPAVEPLDGVAEVEDARGERPGAGLLAAERARAVRRAIRSLPHRQRATLVLRVYHELSHQQIADILGSSVGAVKANFFHALNSLRRILGHEP